MAAHARVVLYGNSVFLAGIRAELERDASLELIPIETGSADALDVIRAHKPRALLYDLAVGPSGFGLNLLHEQPGLLLIGVDPSSDDLLVFSGHAHQALGLSDLVQLIHRPGP